MSLGHGGLVTFIVGILPKCDDRQRPAGRNQHRNKADVQYVADANPRICCMPRTATRFDVYLERGHGICAGRGAVVPAYEDCALAVVLRAPADPDFVVKRTNCGSASDIQQLSRAHAAHERFFAA